MQQCVIISRRDAHLNLWIQSKKGTKQRRNDTNTGVGAAPKAKGATLNATYFFGSNNGFIVLSQNGVAVTDHHLPNSCHYQ